LGLDFTTVAWVQSLVWELRSHIKPLHVTAKRKNKKKKKLSTCRKMKGIKPKPQEPQHDGWTAERKPWASPSWTPPHHGLPRHLLGILGHGNFL